MDINAGSSDQPTLARASDDGTRWQRENFELVITDSHGARKTDDSEKPVLTIENSKICTQINIQGIHDWKALFRESNSTWI